MDGRDSLDREPVTADLTRREERMQVGTELVPHARVIVRKRVVEETRSVQVAVRREELEIVQEPVGSGSANERTIEPLLLVLSEEVPEVTLRVRPYESVRVSVVRAQDETVVEQELAHEEIDVVNADGWAAVVEEPGR